MGDPDAADAPGLLAAAALEVAFDDGLLLDELLDEHALTETAAARAAAMTTKILRRRRMELFLPHVSAAVADHALTCTTVTCASLAPLRIVNKHSPCNGLAGQTPQIRITFSSRRRSRGRHGGGSRLDE
jgi:hypothetical protein